MFKWKRMPWLAALALGTVLALAGGCSDDDDDDEDDEFDLRAGTWALTGTTSESGGAGCTEESGPDTMIVEICDPDSLFQGFVCDIETDGNEFSSHCTGTQTLGECTFTFHLESEGTFTETTYTATSILFVTVSPTTPACTEFVSPCTTTVHETGTWLDSGDCATKPGVPLQALLRRTGSLTRSN